MTDHLEAPDSRPSAAYIRAELDQRLQREIETARRLLENTEPFVLASASPRRRELFAALGARFDVDAADIPEVPRSGETTEQFVTRAACEKAAHVTGRHPHRLVLGADTVVALDGEILGKPRDRDDARRMLRNLAQRTHRVCTGLALVVDAAAAQNTVVATEVTFGPISTSEIDAYIESGEPFDKAGAYGIQGGGGRFVVAVSGSYSNVIGLPVIEVAHMLPRRQHP